MFIKLDDFEATGGRLPKSSTMMMVSHLKLQYLSENHTDLDTKYRWTGKMMGLAMGFTLLVTRWVPGKK